MSFQGWGGDCIQTWAGRGGGREGKGEAKARVVLRLGVGSAREAAVRTEMRLSEKSLRPLPLIIGGPEQLKPTGTWSAEKNEQAIWQLEAVCVCVCVYI